MHRHARTLTFGCFRFNRDSLELWHRKRPVEAPQRALAVLDRLLESPGELVSQDEILASAWRGTHVTPTSLTEAVSRLRSALGDDATHPRYVETVRGRGYRFVGRLHPPGVSRLLEMACRLGAGLPAGSFERHRIAAAGLTVLALTLAAMTWISPDSDARAPVLARLSPGGQLVEELDLPLAGLHDAAPSPDGRQLALSVRSRVRSEIWVLDSGTRALHRISRDADSTEAVWSPDGKWLAWAEDTGSGFDLVRRPADGSGLVERLLDAPGNQYPEAWAPHGNALIYSERGRGSGFDLAVLRQTGPSTWVSCPLRATPHSEYLGSFSPDGRQVIYESDESGRAEIYLLSLDWPSEPVRISRRGGRDPFWSRDGDALFYRRGPHLVRVPAARGERVRLGPALEIPGPGRIVRARPDASGGFVVLLAGR